jgi:hypothetical protein
MTRPPRNPESGYALLFVYMMAASLAIMLYMEIPRVAFEAQRDKEQLLIDRGEQYKRAIQLYVRKYNRFPPISTHWRKLRTSVFSASNTSIR